MLSLIVLLTSIGGCSRTVIEVNGQKVRKNAYYQEVRARERMHEGKHVVVSDELVQKSAISALINKTIILQEAKKKEIAINQGEFVHEWTDFLRRFESEAEFRDYLAKRNLSERDLKRSIIDTAISEKFYDFIYQNIEVTDEEVVRFYQNLNWKNIGPINMKVAIIKGQNKRDVEKILSEIKSSAFEMVFWDIVKHKRKGVEVRKPFWVDPESFDQDMVREIQKILTGKYKGPIQIHDEWYIIQVMRREAKMPEFDEIKENLRKSIHEKRAKQAIDTLLKERVASSEIKVYTERL